MRSAPAMYHVEIPLCARLSNTGTVVTRHKIAMEVQDCCTPEPCPGSDGPVIVFRPAKCDSCYRTRYSSSFSDCDSAFVDTYKPYRARAARSRYVNVCAAVCLLLLVGVLSPKSAARTMQKHPCSSDPENELWGNPCDYKNDSVAQNVAYTPEMSRRIASQAKHAFRQMEEYKDMFALRLHSYPSFEELLIEWEGYEWLRKLYEDVLPRNKTLFKPVPDNEMEPFLKTKLKETLPHMYKALKMVLAGLYSTVENGLSDNIYSDEDLKNNIVSSITEVRAVLCQFHDVMLSLHLEIIPLDDSEVPDFREDRLCLILLIYRDSMNYLEYLAQVFQMEHDRRDL